MITLIGGIIVFLLLIYLFPVKKFTDAPRYRILKSPNGKYEVQEAVEFLWLTFWMYPCGYEEYGCSCNSMEYAEQVIKEDKEYHRRQGEPIIVVKEE